MALVIDTIIYLLVQGYVCAMNNFIPNLNHNSEDVEEGQLPDDGFQQPVSNLSRKSPEDDHYSAQSSEIILETVYDKNYAERNTLKKGKRDNRESHYPKPAKEKEANNNDRLQKDKNIQNDRNSNSNLAPRKADQNNQHIINNPMYPPSYYPPYMYSHPMQMQIRQYPHMYPPYSLPQYMPLDQKHPYNGQPTIPPNYQQNLLPAQLKPNQISHQLPLAVNSGSQFKYPIPSSTSLERNGYKLPNIYPPPSPYIPAGYPSYPLPFPPFPEYYERPRQYNYHEQNLKKSRKRQFLAELRNELKRNVLQFNHDQTFEILETVKCLLKFESLKSSSSSPNSHDHNTETPQNQSDSIKQLINSRCYEKSLLKIQGWLEGQDTNIREFMKGLLGAMQMNDVFIKINEMKLQRKMQRDNNHSETKRLLDLLVRDPKKMIF